MTNSDHEKIATFYVVPVVPDDTGTETVLYYEEVENEQLWTKVSSKDLNAKRQNCHADKIRLVQKSDSEILKHTGLPKQKLAPDAHLFAGVAKTLGEHEEHGMETLYHAHHQRMTIAVRKNTVRGLILIFARSQGQPGMESPVTALIATTDPEIKNSTGAED